MIKKIIVLLMMLALFSVNAETHRTKGERVNRQLSFKIDRPVNTRGDVIWSAVEGSTFDKGGNGYGWYQGYNKKIQTNFDPETGHMLGSIYRQLNNESGSGTIGGMAGAWGESGFSGFAQTIYAESSWQNGTTGDPGGRYPNASEFINGYFFGIFNDYDLSTDGEVSQPMFTVCDATYGWDLSMWSDPKRIEASEGGAVIPAAWTGQGDVVYDPETGYYYWTTVWVQWLAGLDLEFPNSIVTGRTKTPTDPESWEWTDYNDLTLDSTTPEGVTGLAGKIQPAYAKDIYGNGNGNAVIIGMFQDETFYMEDSNGDPVDLDPFMRLGYIYTNNWGADSDTGDFKVNWKTPNDQGINMFPSDINKLFDWYNTIYTDADSVEVPLNLPYFQWNTASVVTENNIVHVLIRLAGASTESEFIYYANDEDYIAGYYDIVGEITDNGIDWIRATHIASWMGIEDGTEEWKYSNNHDLGIGYAGEGTVYTTWIDRPYARYNENPFPEPNKTYICDAYFTYSPDDGRTWDIDKTDTFTDPDGGPDFHLNYAKNITNTGSLHDEGYQVATHGLNEDGTMTVYSACQYYDPNNPLPDPVNDFYDHQQFYKVWQVTGEGTGIEAEEISLTKDFDLHQNYPNPFNPSTEIKFNLANSSEVKLTVFNAKGESVMNLKDEEMSKGLHTVNFDGSSLNSGVYFYKLEVNGRSEAKKMVLMK